jgi:predicted small secreted protein
MTFSVTTKVAAALCVMLALSSCGNTIRGMGKDAANTVDATQNAGNRVGHAATKKRSSQQSRRACVCAPRFKVADVVPSLHFCAFGR